MSDVKRPHGSKALVAILGSSTALGVGASSVETSWVGRLSLALQRLNIEVRNVSIAGSNTADSLERFDRDIVPLSPAFVVLATSIANEPTIEDAATVAQVYTQNTRLLIEKVQDLGAIPILITPYPQAIFNSKYRDQMLEIARDFEAEGVTVWDFWNAADDGFGHWLPGLSSDGTHPTDVGHLALFQTINLAFFGYALETRRPFPPLQRFGAWVANSSAGVPFIAIAAGSAAPSWTVAFWDEPPLDRQSVVLLDIEGSAIRVQRNLGQLEILLNGSRLGTADGDGVGGFHHLCLVYAQLTGALTLYLNGTATITAVVPGLSAATRFYIGSPGDFPGLNGEAVAQFLVYRTPLCASDVRQLATGRFPVKSIEANLPLTQSPSRLAQNVADTNIEFQVGGSWRWVDAGPGFSELSDSAGRSLDRLSAR